MGEKHAKIFRAMKQADKGTGKTSGTEIKKVREIMTDVLGPG